VALVTGQASIKARRCPVIICLLSMLLSLEAIGQTLATEPKALMGSQRFSRRASRRCVVQTQLLAEIALESTGKKLSTNRLQSELH
jgi:hypothetical protein